MGILRGASFEERCLISYLAKLVDPRSGTLVISSAEPYRALVALCAVHPMERRAFSELVPRTMSRPGIAMKGAELILADFLPWQRTREPARRLYATEPPAFSRLSSWARFVAAEMVRSADDRGVVWVGSAETYAAHHACVATAEPHHSVRAKARHRIVDAVRALVVDGFLVADASLRVRNFEAAQARAEPRSPRSTDARPALDPRSTRARPALDPRSTDARPALDGRSTDARPALDGRSTDARPYDLTPRNCSPDDAQKSPFPPLPSPPSPTKYTSHADAFGATPSAYPGFSSNENGNQQTLPGVAAAGEPPRRRSALRNGEPPFAVCDALSALQSTSRGRFAAGDEGQWPRSVRVRVAGHVRAFASLHQWRAVGSWLAWGGDAYRGVLGPSWAASDALADAMVRAAAWALSEGRSQSQSQDEIDVVVTGRVNEGARVRVVTLDPLAQRR